MKKMCDLTSCSLRPHVAEAWVERRDGGVEKIPNPVLSSKQEKMKTPVTLQFMRKTLNYRKMFDNTSVCSDLRQAEILSVCHVPQPVSNIQLFLWIIGSYFLKDIPVEQKSGLWGSKAEMLFLLPCSLFHQCFVSYTVYHLFNDIWILRKSWVLFTP